MTIFAMVGKLLCGYFNNKKQNQLKNKRTNTTTTTKFITDTKK